MHDQPVPTLTMTSAPLSPVSSFHADFGDGAASTSASESTAHESTPAISKASSVGEMEEPQRGWPAGLEPGETTDEEMPEEVPAPAINRTAMPVDFYAPP